jgi:hypothetical protein
MLGLKRHPLGNLPQAARLAATATSGRDDCHRYSTLRGLYFLKHREHIIMLAADKLQLQSALKQQATALKEKEFNLHHSNLSKYNT